MMLELEHVEEIVNRRAIERNIGIVAANFRIREIVPTPVG
jgi:hypothetical protein